MQFRKETTNRLPRGSVTRIMRKGKKWQKIKQITVRFRHSMAKSSSLYYLTTNDGNYFEFVDRENIFTCTPTVPLFSKLSCRIELKRTYFVMVNACKDVFANNISPINLVCSNNQCCVSDKKLFLSGDIELNPGPFATNTYGSEDLTANAILENRLHELGL